MEMKGGLLGSMPLPVIRSRRRLLEPFSRLGSCPRTAPAPAPRHTIGTIIILPLPASLGVDVGETGRGEVPQLHGPDDVAWCGCAGVPVCGRASDD